jgi:hypothetical protein
MHFTGFKMCINNPMLKGNYLEIYSTQMVEILKNYN